MEEHSRGDRERQEKPPAATGGLPPTGDLALELRAELAEVERLAAAIEEFGAARGLSTRDVFNLNLALDEVVTNVISYAYPAGQAGPVAVRVAISDEEVTAEVRDEGAPFDPLGAPEPDLAPALQERSVGGLGIFLVRQVMDHVAYRRDAGRNILVMTKKRGPA